MWLLILIGLVSLVLVCRYANAYIYDLVIIKMTTEWYRIVFDYIPQGSVLLDVGIGTGTALVNNQTVLRSKDFTVVGIDYEPNYVKLCNDNFVKHNLTETCKVKQASIYDYEHNIVDSNGKSLTHIYFSGSLMIMPDPLKALQHVAGLLPEDGIIVITQTFEQKRNKLLEVFFPLFFHFY